MANRNGPELRADMRAEKRSGGASIEMLKTARHTTSRQYEKRSRSGIASVDQIAALTSVVEGRCWYLTGSHVALSTNLLALPPKIASTGLCLVAVDVHRISVVASDGPQSVGFSSAPEDYLKRI